MNFFKTLISQLAWAAGILLLLYGVAAMGRLAEGSKSRQVQLRVALFINGSLGDKSFFDSAVSGLYAAKKDFPIMAKVIEGGTDPMRWESALTDLADSGDYDLIIAGTYSMVPYVQKIASGFPAMKFVVFDASVDYAACACKNVHSILFRQNEGAYLAGYLAARLMETGLPDVQAGSGLGVIGGMPIPVVDDFVGGFLSGAKAAVHDIHVMTQYANAFSDPAVGKEIAKAQYQQGIGLIFHAAGATGQGVNEAAEEARGYVIGVDMDQYALYEKSNPSRAARIVTSVMKDVGISIYRSIQQELNGQTTYGKVVSLGLAEGGIKLARNSKVMANTRPAIVQAVNDQERAIILRKVIVPSVFGMHETSVTSTNSTHTLPSTDKVSKQ
ncbi:BMP family lipoprotein [Undibacterium sp. SXout7W]|uniref:BMP family lipoprotein n=1 Tax=Undibacterium sp. SXout7W TaxID=3413049 RepID=UPI003BF21949